MCNINKYPFGVKKYPEKVHSQRECVSWNACFQYARPGRPAIPKKMWLNRLYRGATRAKKVPKKSGAKSPISRRKSGWSGRAGPGRAH